jgi:acetyltransferase EpsM
MNDQRRLILLGGGGHAAVVAETARAAGWTIEGYLDDREPEPDGRRSPAFRVGLRWMGTTAELSSFAEEADDDVAMHAAVGDNALRRAWLIEASHVPAPAIAHPRASISPTAKLGRGVFVGPGAIVNARAEIGAGVIVNSGAIVEHDCRIGAFSHVAPRAVLGGDVAIGEGSLIGIGATVRPGVRIGRNVTVGAGAVVVGDFSDDARAIGVPARSTR